MLRDRGEAKQVLPNHQNGLPALQELLRHPDSGARLQPGLIGYSQDFGRIDPPSKYPQQPNRTFF